MRDDLQAGVVSVALLAQRLDADVVLGEHRGDGGQDAGLVGEVEGDVVARRRLLHRQHRKGSVGRLTRAVATAHAVAGDRDDVADHCACRRCTTGAWAVEHQLASGVRLDEDCVVGVPNRCERVVARHHRRMHAHVDAAAVDGPLGDGQQLDDVPGVLGGRDDLGGDVGDALAVDVGQRDARVEGKAGDDGGLGSRVMAFDIGRGVRLLGVPELLRLSERVVERGATLVHLREDEVGGSVHDSQDSLHPVAGQRLAQRSQQRDRAGNARLEVEIEASCITGLVQLGAVLGEERLVPGDDAGA